MKNQKNLSVENSEEEIKEHNPDCILCGLYGEDHN